MRVIMGINAPWVGGTRIHVLTLAQALITRGHRLVLITDPGVLEDELNQRGIPYRVRAGSTEGMLRLLLELVEELHPDIIHAHPAKFILESYLTSQITGVPFVATMHGEYLMQFCCDALGRRIAQAVSQVIAVSEQIKDYLVRATVLDSGKVTVIPNGIDFVEYSARRGTNELREMLSLRAGEKVLMYLGRLDSDKADAITAAVGVVRLLRSRGDSVKGVFVGTGDLFTKLQGCPDIILTGFQRNIPELLSVADVVIATGRSALEALAVGKPVVAVGRAGLHGLVNPRNWRQAVATNFGDHGVLSQPEPGQLLAHVQQGLQAGNSSEGSTELYRLVYATYDLTKVVSRLEKIYEQAQC